ncbi:MAG TPA: TIGR04282 family arsenosugar biosynthesis glycosyltransferase [Gemmatimonadales bacterium]|nr:TIGR04282 family arsenosugar biosynthesis glycosyltransferase [Gemmatimonadales bacterium]
MTPLVALFLQAPRSGAVKTRLASAIGDRQALRLYRVMASRTLGAVRQADFDATVWFAPADAAVEMRRWLGEAWDLRPQASGDLATRLAAAEQAVTRGRGWLALTGDCPRLDGELLRVAGAIAARGEVALGPSAHGGCYLIGGRTPLPSALFEAGSWSASGALADTRAQLTRAGVVWRELPTLREVDSAEDARAEGLLT